jgi:hypothetical protein
MAMDGMELLSASLPLVGVVTLFAAIVRRHPLVMKWRLAVKHLPDPK